MATCVLSVCFQVFKFGKLVDCHANIQYDWPWHRFSVSMDRFFDDVLFVHNFSI